MISTSMSSKKDTIDHIKKNTKHFLFLLKYLKKIRFIFTVYLHMVILQISWCGRWKTNLFTGVQDFTKFTVSWVIHNRDFLSSFTGTQYLLFSIGFHFKQSLFFTYNESIIYNYSFKQSKPVIYTVFLSWNEVCCIVWVWFIYLIVPLSPRVFFAIAFILKWQFFTLSVILLFRQEFFHASI